MRQQQQEQGGGRSARGSGEAAVSDVVGSILLVGITVVSAAGLGVLILSFDGPEDALHADIELRVDPGTDPDWGTGDEKLQVLHLGGEAIAESGTTIQFVADGVTYSYSDGDLDFVDGALSIGETWESPDDLDLDEDDEVDVDLVSAAAGAVVATGTITGRGTVSSGGGGTGCSSDTTPPSAAVSKDPADISVLTADQTPTVTAVVTDLACGVDEDAAPVLKWGYASPPTNPVTMALSAGVWSAEIPDQGAWSGHSGETLYYQVTGMTDLKAPTANVGSTAIFSDLVGESYTYVTAHTDRVGSIPSLTGAQSDDGTVASTLTEGASASATVEGSSFTGTMTNPQQADDATDNLYAVSSTSVSGQSVEVSGFDVPTAATGIREVKVSIEARETSNGQDPVLRVDWRIGSTGSFIAGTATQSVSGVSDAQYTFDLTDKRDWTVADVEALQLQAVATTTRSVSIDLVALSVVHGSSGGAQQSAATVLEFDGVPDTTADSYTLQLRYQTSGDTFVVQSWDPTQNSNNGGWVTEGTLNSAGSFSNPPFTATLSVNEFNGGSPLVRILDATPTGGTAGTLQLEYARVWAQ